jgi:hypothetical protein
LPVAGITLTSEQYACAAAGLSAELQALEVDVKSVETVEEVMRMAAPCPPTLSSYPCAAGINTSLVVVFTENTMLDSMVARASAGKIRALPYGLFSVLRIATDFSISVGGIRGEDADDSGKSDHSFAYHNYNRVLFTNPALKLEIFPWPGVVSSNSLHATWIVNAAVDAWLNVVPFPYLHLAHDVVNARTSASFSPDPNNAAGANGRQCTLASIHLDRARYYLKTKQHNEFVEGGWFCIDLSSVCLFSALNLKLQHPARDRIEQNFNNIFWKLHQLDHTPLPPLKGCDECVLLLRLFVRCNHQCSYVATDGKRLADLYGHLPGYWIHPSLVIATFAKNVTKASGTVSIDISLASDWPHAWCYRGTN